MSTTTRYTYDRFEEMLRRGEFDSIEERFELLEGEIVIMPTPDPLHEYSTDIVSQWGFRDIPRENVWVRVQGSVALAEFDSIPLPDLLLLQMRDYSSRRPTPADVLLVVEVSNTSLSKDRNRKARLYAAAGIAEYWIVNIPKRCLEVRRDPQGSAYRGLEVFQPGQDVRPLAFPDAVLAVSRLFPE